MNSVVEGIAIIEAMMEEIKPIMADVDTKIMNVINQIDNSNLSGAEKSSLGIFAIVRLKEHEKKRHAS